MKRLIEKHQDQYYRSGKNQTEGTAAPSPTVR